MGGYGSGRHGWKGSTANYRQIDVRMMQRKGYLGPGMQSSLWWSRNGEPTGSINYRVQPDRIILSYRHRRHDSEEWQSVEYAVLLDRTRCNYGGERAWFRCPARGCGRRVAVLWGGEIFACRQCHNLAYESQNETAHSRALTKAQAIRVKLGGEPGLIHDFPDKPKGMHWRTYYRLRAQADEAENRSWPPWVFKMMA
jgi:hypothetical protein